MKTPTLTSADLIRLAERFGPWVAIASFLIWWLTTDISGTVRQTRDLVLDHIRESNFYSRQICINTAHDDAQRANCIPSTGNHEYRP